LAGGTVKVIGFPATVSAILRRRVFLALAIGVLIVGGAAAAWRWSRAKKPQYVTAAVTRGNIRRSIGTTGALNPLVTVQVGSNVSGIIRSLGCDYNTEVQVGQVCATIDPVPFQLIVDQDRAQVGTVEAQLEKDRAALTYAKVALDRDTKLRADGSVSQDAVDNDRNVYRQAVAQLGVDKASLLEKQAALKGAEVNLAYTHIVSPVVGTVITRAIDVGQTVAASLQAPTLFLIAKDLTRMQVDTNVSEADVGAVRVGQEAVFTVQAFAGRSFHGKVSQIRRGPITVQNVVTYDVVLAVSNPDLALFPGMTADAHIVLDEHENVLRVPLPAVRFNPEGIGRVRGGSAGETAARSSGPSSEGSGGGRPAGGEVAARSPPAEAEGSMSRDLPGEERRGRGPPGEEGRERTRSADRGDRAGFGDRGDRAGFGDRGDRTDRGDQKREHRSRVWVLRNDSLQAVPVITGIDDGTLIEVSGEGIQAGDVVVVNIVNPEERRRNATVPGQNVLRQTGPGPRL
jgi:HlyD family secretion protein